MNDPRAAGPAAGPEPSEAQLRAAFEEEMRRLRVEDLLAQTVVSLLNLGARRAGLAGGGDDDLDLGQTASAIEAVTALLGVLEKGGGDLRPLRDALAQLQMAYARRSGGAEPGAGDPQAQPSPAGAPGPAPGDEGKPASAEPGQPGPAESSGRLWVPGS